MRMPERPKGIPAIPPRATPASPAEPAFTAEDVAAYILAHPVAGTGKIEPHTPITIDSIEFLPGREVHARLGRTTGAPDETVLCFVTLRGSFTVSGMRGTANLHATRAWRVFDGQTGNLLAQAADLRARP